MSYGNEPTKAPDIKGMGRAWRVTATPEAEFTSATVGSDWLVHAPYGHPFWWWYAVSVVHLRPLPGMPPPNMVREDATHEIMFLALDPSHPLPDVDNWAAMKYLTPPDLAWQFIVDRDEQAKELGDLVVRHICDGQSPDQDFRTYWHGAIENTVEHICTGGHRGSS